MQTLTQVFWNKVAGAPREWFVSEEGKALITRMTEMIRQKEGEEEARYFTNLCTVSEVLDV